MKTPNERRELLKQSGAKQRSKPRMWILGGIAVEDKALYVMSDNTFAVLRALMGVSEEERRDWAIRLAERIDADSKGVQE